MEIPEEQLKRVKFGNIKVLAYSPPPSDFAEGPYETGEVNPHHMSIDITADGEGSGFRFDIQGRDNLLKLKEAIDFALTGKK